VKIRIRRIDEDRDRREIGDPRGAPGLRSAQRGLLGDPIGLGIEAERRLQLDEPVRDPLLVLVHLRQHGVRLDA
jgi:hypothetical protein